MCTFPPVAESLSKAHAPPTRRSQETLDNSVSCVYSFPPLQFKKKLRKGRNRRNERQDHVSTPNRFGVCRFSNLVMPNQQAQFFSSIPQNIDTRVQCHRQPTGYLGCSFAKAGTQNNLSGVNSSCDEFLTGVDVMKGVNDRTPPPLPLNVNFLVV